MPYHYPSPDEQADRLLPFRWQVETIEDARRLVAVHLHQQNESISQAFFKRCSERYK
jgi:hypothetical protein